MIEYLKKKKVLRYFKIFGLIFNINKQNLQVLLINKVEENISLNFRLRKIDEKEIKHNYLDSKKHKSLQGFKLHWLF